MLHIGTAIDCANPVNRRAALNKGLLAWHCYVPGLANDCAPTVTSIAGSICHDLTKLPGSLARLNGSGINEGAHAIFNGTGSFLGNNRPGGFGRSVKHGSGMFLGGYGASGASRFMFAKTDPFSIFLWAYITGFVGTGTNLVSNFISTTNPGWIFEIGPTPSPLRFRIIDENNTVGRVVSGATTPTQRTWTQLGVTYDGSNTAAGIKLWINGQPDSLTVETDTDPGTLSAYLPQWGGKVSGSLNDFYSGNMDDLRIYDRCLQASEVRQLCNAARSGYQNELNRISLPVFNGPASVGGLSRFLLLGVGG